MTKINDYDSIPGTYVYDSERSRLGYALNMFCMSLNKPENRVSFKSDEAAYLDHYSLTAEQRRTVLERDWLGMLKAGGNIYYTIKIAFCDGLTFQDVAGMMSGVPKETYAQMMLAGGRTPDGNRFKDPSKATDPNKATDPSEATDSNRAMNPSEATDSNKATDPSEATDSNKAMNPSEATDSNKAMDPSEVTDSNNATSPSEVTDPNKTADPNKATE